MKIAILGGGITGLTAAYYLAKKGYRVTILEKKEEFGGLASGFKQKNWQWTLEQTYHHIFTSDDDILSLAKEVGFNKFFFQSPITASLYFDKKDSLFKTYRLDRPIDLLRFPYLNIGDKIRISATLGFLKLSPYFSFYEKEKAVDFLKKTMGEKSYSILFEQLFRKKFGKYAKNILLSFFWARIKKRSLSLGYPIGGFQGFIDFLVDRLKKLDVSLLSCSQIIKIKKQSKIFTVNYLINKKKGSERFDLVLSTLPTPILVQTTKELFPAKFRQNLRKLCYLHALTLILETDKPILDKSYWLNITTSDIPIMVLVQHTNFIDKKYYGNNHLLYCGWYLSKEDRLWRMNDRQIFDLVFKNLKLIKNLRFQVKNYYLFRAPFAQPIFDKDFIKNKPNFITPVKNFFIANLDMTYPYDRGTNYAVRLGKEATKIIVSENPR